MVFIFCSIRTARNISCLPSLKLSVVSYSTEATPNPKQQLSPSRVRVSQPSTKSVQSRIVVPNLTVPPEQRETIIQKSLDNDIQKNVCLNNKEDWKHVEVDSANLRKHCLMLSKIRLTSLVVVTTMAGYALAPAPFDISTFIACSVGTGMVSATANSINQFFEVPFDAQMSRTKNRVLVRGHLTPAHAIIFATVSGVGGLALLYSEVNGLTAALGATNLVLYTLIYTPMKRVSILNTWVGSVVGAIPPLMGWAGCVGDITAPGAWIMSGLLYAWQFPHFNALSWNLRPDYSRAGYRMMAVTDPNLCRRTALRYTAVLTGLCYLAPMLNVTNWWFAAMSTPLNAYFLHLAWKFHKQSDSGSSRKLFHFSLVHLPVLMILMLVNKKYWFLEDKNEKKDNAIGKQTENDDVSGIFTKLITSVSSTA